MLRLVASIVGILMASLAHAQIPRGTAEISLQGNDMTIEYGRPSLQGRDMLGKAPVGTVWRLGADQATSMTVTGAITFGQMVAQNGKYSLFLERVTDDDWSLIVNSQTGQWGTEHNPNKDLLGVPLKWEKQEDSTEQLTITLTRETDATGIVTIRWGKDVLRQRFRLSPPR